VHGQQPQQFHARVSGSANDANFDHVLFLRDVRMTFSGRGCILTAMKNACAGGAIRHAKNICHLSR
jgi:hypothetical protein